MANEPFGGQGGNVGTGNPYYGSGWTNFDKFLNDTNLGWGAEQSDYNYGGTEFDSGVNFNNYLTQRAHPEWEYGNNAPPEQPATSPGEGTVDTGTEAKQETPPTAWDEYMTKLDAWDAQNPQDQRQPVGGPRGPSMPRPKAPPGYDAQGNPTVSNQTVPTYDRPEKKPLDGGRNTEAW